MRRAQNKYWGLPQGTPMGPSRWASQVSLKSLIEETKTERRIVNGSTNGYTNSRPVSQLSQYSTTSYDTAYTTDGGGRSSPSMRSYVIPIEREDGVVLRNHQHHHHEGCSHDHDHIQQRSSIKRTSAAQSHSDLNNTMGRWSGSLNNLQYVAKNENPYNYLEPGKFPVESKHIRFSDTVTKREFHESAW